ncbi:MAG TPA: tetratricopeptide repeat protein, partial [Terriglobales bacterium]|nr:tetratricopeptide repeat protein [Terriglobales bacterium]
ISRPSVMRYKGSKEPLPQIARELGVDALVSGTVVRAGDRVRVSAQLVDGRMDRQIWAEAYERDLRDVLSLQREVAQAIVGEIRVKVTPQEKERLAASRQVNPKAYEAYLRGRAAWSKQTEESLKKAIEFFQQAITEDPLYSQAYAGMADSYFLLGFGFSPPKEVWPNAKAAALKATEMDDSLAEGHVSLGIVLAYYNWAWADAERELKRAIDLNPGYGNSHHWYGHYLHSVGRLDEALAQMQKAHELDPLSPFMSDDIGTIYFLRREYDHAVDQSRKTIDLDPSYYEVYEVLGLAYEQKGMFSEAIAAFEKGNALAKAEILTGDIGHAYAAWGKKAEAQKRLDELAQRSKTAYVSNFDIALIHTGLGEKDRAFESLDKAYDERSFSVGFAAKMDPRFDPLRPDPRWNKMLQKMGLNN